MDYLERAIRRAYKNANHYHLEEDAFDAVLLAGFTIAVTNYHLGQYENFIDRLKEISTEDAIEQFKEALKKTI
jgi:hypothetical protein